MPLRSVALRLYKCHLGSCSALRSHHARQQAEQAIKPWLDRFDAVVIGPGLGRDLRIQYTVMQVRRQTSGAWCVG